MTTVAVINQKGGVGKTTTAMNLGAAMAETGRRVLLIDLDPQGNLSSHAGADVHAVAKTIYDVLLGGDTLRAVMVATQEPNLWLVPSNIDLSAAELELVSQVGRETILRDALAALAADGGPPFDFVVIDCPPSLGLLSINALAAVDQVLIPMQAEFFALQGMAKLLEVVELVRRRLNHKVSLAGIVACRVDRRPRLTQEVLDEIAKHFPGRLFSTVIRANVKLAEAPSHGRSVLGYASDSNGADDYRALAREYQARFDTPAV